MHDVKAQVCSQIENSDTDFCVNIHFLCTCMHELISQEQQDKSAPAKEEPMEALPSEDMMLLLVVGLQLGSAKDFCSPYSRHVSCA